MKKLLTLLLLTQLSFAQEITPYVSFSVGVDVRNATFGSQPTNNKPEIDYQLGFEMTSFNRVQVGIFYENFNRIKFDRYGFSVGYELTYNDKITITPSIESSLINRGEVPEVTQGSGSFFSYGANLRFKYEIIDNLCIGVRGNVIARTDLNYLYGGRHFVPSGYLELIYKIELY